MVPAEKILGMKIKRDRDQEKLFLCQKEYIQKVLNYFGMTFTKSVGTRLIVSARLSKLKTISQNQRRNKCLVFLRQVLKETSCILWYELDKT